MEEPHSLKSNEMAQCSFQPQQPLPEEDPIRGALSEKVAIDPSTSSAEQPDQAEQAHSFKVDFKTRLCWFYSRGHCKKKTCRFAHGLREMPRPVVNSATCSDQDLQFFLAWHEENARSLVEQRGSRGE